MLYHSPDSSASHRRRGESHNTPGLKQLPPKKAETQYLAPMQREITRRGAHQHDARLAAAVRPQPAAERERTRGGRPVRSRTAAAPDAWGSPARSAGVTIVLFGASYALDQKAAAKRALPSYARALGRAGTVPPHAAPVVGRCPEALPVPPPGGDVTTSVVVPTTVTAMPLPPPKPVDRH